MNINKDITNKTIGDYGEEIACKYLKNHGFAILTRNYRYEGGEIDIIATKGKSLFFVEVKTSVRLYKRSLDADPFRPEVRVNQSKRLKIRQTARHFLSHIRDHMNECVYSSPGFFRELDFAIISIVIDRQNKKGIIRFMNNLTF